MDDDASKNGIFGTALRNYRRRAGLSQRELAEQTGLDFSYISKIENGRLPPPAADTVVLLSQALGVEVEELLALTGKIPSEVRRAFGTSRMAQRFMLEAQQLELTDEEWKAMASALRSLRSEP
jgi:transcriptional regulator with XRE-family HTH domain